MNEDKQPSCPAVASVGDGADSIDLMCWSDLDHEGDHLHLAGEEPVYWMTKSERDAP